MISINSLQRSARCWGVFWKLEVIWEHRNGDVYKRQAFKQDKNAKACFEKLTPGKQREYLEFITEAKGEETRKRRVAKSIPIILEGRGLNDKYK